MTDDTATLSAIAGIRTDVGSLRTDVSAQIAALRSDLTQRLDQTVTRREHDAVVGRQDAETKNVRQALEAHEASANQHLVKIEGDIEAEAHARADVMTAMMAAIKDADDKRETALEAVAERRRADRRFIVGVIFMAVSAASAATGVLVSIFGG